ncbi:MAG: hypothetical protein RLP44_20975 [Aggregatilineales bacterium]
MSITIEWDNPERTILRYDIRDTWRWQDARDAIDTIFTMMDNAEADVICTIPHFVGKVNLPPDGLKHFAELTERSHPKAGLTVIVGANFMMRSVISTVRGMYTMTGRSVDFDYADTLDDARRKIERFMMQAAR